MIVLGLSYPRRQQYRRLLRAGGGAAAGLAAAVAAVLTAAAGAGRLAGVLLVAVLGCLVYTRHWARLAGRSRVGARSEREVRNALSGLRGEGWRLRHSVRWQGRGDIDTIALAPSGLGFAIETKTRTFDYGHIAAVREMADLAWASPAKVVPPGRPSCPVCRARWRGGANRGRRADRLA